METEIVNSIPSGQKRIYVEGNIACGKSTFLNNLKNYFYLQILLEPIEKWENYNGENLLEKFYQNPKENTFNFQRVAQYTMFDRENNNNNTAPILLLERSIYSEWFIFIKINYLEGNLNDGQMQILNDNANYFKGKMTKPDFIIYLRSDPKKCYERLKQRNRNAETGVTLEYLTTLHNYHEELYINNQHLLPAPVIIIDANESTINCVNNFWQIILTNYKFCNKCKYYKQRTEFYKMTKSKDGLQNRCIDCNRTNLREHMNKKYQDPQFYEIQKIRNRLSQVKNKKESMTLGKVLGISFDLFHEWLEYQRNGEIIEDEEIDHVLPISKFGTLPLCSEYINLRPLSHIKNSGKRDHVDLTLYQLQLIKALSFIQKIFLESKIDIYTFLEKKEIINARNFSLINGEFFKYC